MMVGLGQSIEMFGTHTSKCGSWLERLQLRSTLPPAEETFFGFWQNLTKRNT